MKSAAIAIALLMTLGEPGSAAGFDAVDAGAIHDTGALASTPAGIAMLSSGATVMVGVTLTGDTVSSFAPLIARVEPDGTVAWTRSGASLAWQASRVVEGPDDTVIVYGSNASPAPGDYLARFDADGAELWNERILLESMLVDLVVDATGITAIENPEPEDARLTRFSPDGSLLWQANVSALAGCMPMCPNYAAIAMAADPGRGIVVLSDYQSTGLPAETRLLEVGDDGTLLWETALAAVESPVLARSANGRIGVLGRDHASGDLRLQVRENDGTDAWDQTIGTSGATVASSLAFDGADNAYALAGDANTLTTHAFAPAGTPRWSDAWPVANGANHVARLSAGASTDPVVVVAGLEDGDTFHGIAQDGTRAFDTTLYMTSGSLSGVRRRSDGSLVSLDSTRTGAFSMLLGRVGPDGNDGGVLEPGPAESPTQTTPDAIAWQDDGSTTIFAVGIDAFLTRLAPNGDALWRADVPGAYSGIARAFGDDTLIAYYRYDPSGPVTTLQRRDAAGAVVWDVDEPGAYSDFAARADGGSMLLANDLGIWRLERRDADGAPVGSSPLSIEPSQTFGLLYGPQVIPSRDGGAYVFGPGGDNGAPFVEKFDASGASLWHRTYAGQLIGNRARGLAEDENGVAYLAYDDVQASLTSRVLRLGAEGAEVWSVAFPSEGQSPNGRSLIAANGGGVLLATSTGVHRINADGGIAWSYADDCSRGCIPDAIRQRADGHAFALSSIGVESDFGYGTTAVRVVEIDEDGDVVDAFVSVPRPLSQDIGLDVRADRGTEVVELSALADSLKRVRVLRLNTDALFANGFDPAG